MITRRFGLSLASASRRYGRLSRKMNPDPILTRVRPVRLLTPVAFQGKVSEIEIEAAADCDASRPE